jgi:hypothetical protein
MLRFDLSREHHARGDKLCASHARRSIRET